MELIYWVNLKLLLEGKGFVGHFIREIKSHVYGKRQTSDSSWEFQRIENKDIKTFQNSSYG